MQTVEILVGVLLVWFGIHEPDSAPVLFGAAGAVLAWALIARGPLAAIHLVGADVHRVGGVVLGIGLLVVPLAVGRATDLLLVIPMVLAGLVLIRLSVRRLPPQSAVVPQTTPVPVPGSEEAPPQTESSRQIESSPRMGTVPDTENVPQPESLLRQVGRVAGRADTQAGNIVGRTDLGRSARVAGRVAGRMARRRSKPADTTHAATDPDNRTDEPRQPDKPA